MITILTFECDGHTVHMLTQQCLLPPLTSTVKSSLFSMRIPIHFPWLPGYIDVSQTVLVILTMAGLFSDRPRILLYKSVRLYREDVTKIPDFRVVWEERVHPPLCEVAERATGPEGVLRTEMRNILSSSYIDKTKRGPVSLPHFKDLQKV